MGIGGVNTTLASVWRLLDWHGIFRVDHDFGASFLQRVPLVILVVEFFDV